MKTKQINAQPVTAEIEYPCLMESIVTGAIIYMCTAGNGVIVDNRGYSLSKGYHDNGYHSTTWHMPNFTPYTGILALSNGDIPEGFGEEVDAGGFQGEVRLNADRLPSATL